MIKNLIVDETLQKVRAEKQAKDAKTKTLNKSFHSRNENYFKEEINSNVPINISPSLGHPTGNKTKDWALVQNAALVMKIKVLKLGLVR